jgi:hypothetical protein
MPQSGLDHRHRDKEGEIQRKHGNTLIGTLRKIYGQNFARGLSDEMRLSEALGRMPKDSLSQLVRDHRRGQLEQKLFVRGRFGNLGSDYHL